MRFDKGNVKESKGQVLTFTYMNMNITLIYIYIYIGGYLGYLGAHLLLDQPLNVLFMSIHI